MTRRGGTGHGRVDVGEATVQVEWEGARARADGGGAGRGERGGAAGRGAAPDAREGGQAQEPFTVSEALAVAKGALEGVRLRVVGEVSEVSDKRGYKAVYFTVKDGEAALPCMMWLNRYRACGVQLATGMLVELAGRFTLYAAKGRMNFDVTGVSLVGEGVLRMQMAQLARKLQAEGLMDPARKRPLPPFPERVGLVTSPRGAAVHDVLRTLRERFPLARVLFAGVPVEGVGAARGIAGGLQCVVDAGVDVVLLVRGGGSYEDLVPFNDEGLARTIAACPVPVVTGIGHEPDTTLADLVADERALTPTFAALAASPDAAALAGALQQRAKALHAGVSRGIERGQARVRRVADRPVFGDARLLFASEARSLDYAAERLARALPLTVERGHVRLAALQGRLARALPLASAREQARLDALRHRARRAGEALVPRFGQSLGAAAARLHDLSPLAVLGRGYAIARDAEGAVVKSVAQAPAGSRVDVAVADGELACRVEAARTVHTSVEPWGT